MPSHRVCHRCYSHTVCTQSRGEVQPCAGGQPLAMQESSACRAHGLAEPVVGNGERVIRRHPVFLKVVSMRSHKMASSKQAECFSHPGWGG